MEQFIGCDAHKKFSVFVAVNEKGKPANPCAWLTMIIGACKYAF